VVTKVKMKNFIKKCLAINEAPILVVVRYLINRMIGLNVIQSSNVIIRGRSNISTKERIEIGMLDVGFTEKKDRTVLSVKGNLEINGKFSIAKGCRIDIGENATVKIGSGYLNAFSKLIIMDYLTIEDDCAISWNCQFLDNDFHFINYGEQMPKENGIVIGRHVLICNNVSITKGARIPSGCVVASNSLVTRAFTEPNTLIGGIPAKVLKRDITWS
jgi:acetyltransferase-like isoleucine patch superfamily enzyme